MTDDLAAQPLRRYVVEARQRASLRELEARCVDPISGRRAGKEFIVKIESGTMDRIPAVEHLRALAAGLGLPYERVRRAAIDQWLPGEDAVLSAEEVERLRQDAQDLLDRLDRADARRERGA